MPQRQRYRVVMQELLRLRTLEPQCLEIQLIDEHVHHPNRVVLSDVDVGLACPI